jgi:V8-like Glu-specific endopeptidase
MTRIINYLTCLAVFLLLGVAAKAQPATVPHHTETCFKDLGIHDGNVTDRQIFNHADGSYSWYAEDYKIIRETVRAGAAPWFQLKFDDVNLGEHSYMIITSRYDRDYQYFNAKSIADWHNHSALFKGNAVDIELFVAPNEKDITLRVTGLIVGEFVSNDDLQQMLARTQCGPNDDRMASGYPYVDGRLMSFGCTGWITAAGFYLTAGHCEVLLSSSTIFEFNVPPSLSNGTTQPASVNDQYPVNYTTSVGQNAGTGDDWGIFSCGVNSNTGHTPAEHQRAYYHLSKDLNPPNMFIRGFGVDVGTANQTLQYHTGPANGETVTSATDIYWEYQADTEGGNSGSANLTNGLSGVNFHSVGIHTHGGCATTNPPTGYNKGTSFEADDTEQGMNVFFQTQVEYVDNGHYTVFTPLGTSVRPHTSVQTAASQANAGHGSGRELILIAGSNAGLGGLYQEAFSYSGATNGVTLRRTVGRVVIGPAAGTNPPPPVDPDAESRPWVSTELMPGNAQFPLGPSLTEGAFTLEEFTKVYPNPFTGETTLEFLLNEDRQMTIHLVNALGQQVMTLAENQVHDAGLHRIMIDGSALTAGIYYVVMEGPDYREMIKVSRFEQ